MELHRSLGHATSMSKLNQVTLLTADRPSYWVTAQGLFFFIIKLFLRETSVNVFDGSGCVLNYRRAAVASLWCLCRLWRYNTNLLACQWLVPWRRWENNRIRGVSMSLNRNLFNTPIKAQLSIVCWNVLLLQTVLRKMCEWIIIDIC